MKIFICGHLGEVIKKVLELEFAIESSPGNVVLITELASYQSVLEMWPVMEKEALDTAVDIFRHSLSMLREKEVELRKAETTIDMLFATPRYIRCLDSVREQMKYISELGMAIGTSPVLEVVDADFT